MRKPLSIAVTLLVLSAGMHSGLSRAQDTSTGKAKSDPPASVAQLKQVIVTAQRRAQPLQQVPISLTVFGTEQIQQQGMNSDQDFLALTPDATFSEQGQAGGRSINIAIRGVSNVNLGETAVQNSIGYYIDEFNVGNVSAGTINPPLLDIAQVEVLRGPQGTYFGRNSEGGAINITTNEPNDQWYGEVSVYGGNYNTDGVRVVANVPVSSTFFLRAAGDFESSDGIIKNINPAGTHSSGYNDSDGRLAAKWLITDRFTADLSYTFSHDNQGMDPDVNTGIIEPDTESIWGTFVPIKDGLSFYPQNQSLVDHGYPEFSHNFLRFADLRLTYDFGNFTLKSITGDIQTTTNRQYAEDGVSVNAVLRTNQWAAQSYGEELRLQSKPGGTLDWTVGALYARDSDKMHDDIFVGPQSTYTYPDGTVFVLLPPVPAGLPINEGLGGYVDLASGLYGELTWRGLAPWSFTLGGRYSHDTIEASDVGIEAFGTPQGNLYGTQSFNDFSPRAVAKYDINSDSNVYLTLSHGYKAGGVDLNAEFPQQERPFSPEKVWNEELGYKLSFWDHRAILDASVFDMQWQNVQSQVDYLIVPGNISSAVEITENASSATSKGADLQFQARPIRPLTLGLGLGYLDAHFGAFPGAVIYGVPVDLSGYPMPQSPRWTGSATAEWTEGIGSDSYWNLGVEENYRSDMSADLEGAAAPALGLPSFPFQMPSYAVTNMHLGITYRTLTWQFSVRNLLNKEYYTGTSNHFGLGGVRVEPHPRMWRLELTYKTH
jgi:iron complex outermembrane recepter protein